MPDCPNISVRPGIIEDANDFSNLVVISGELLAQLWGHNASGLMNYLFRFPDNIYGYHHTFFAHRDNQTVGFFLGYPSVSAGQEQSATQRRMIEFLGLHFAKRFFALRTVNLALSELPENSYLLSNIAVYPQFRNTGAGKHLLEKAICDAERLHCTKVVLDVLSGNTTAIRFYLTNGFIIEKTRPVIHLDGKDFQFHKMVFPLGSQTEK
jgi:ribosomal protein S18 acetylase RimI-like enzyme